MNNKDSELITKILIPESDGVILIQNALNLANEVHAGQLRDEGTPYIEHVLRVAERFNHYNTLKVIALLHDVLEDSDEYSYQDIKDQFGEFVADTVRILTKEKGYDMDDYMRNITSNFYALLVKLSDRIDNVKSLPSCPDPQKRSEYILETEKYFLNNPIILRYESPVIKSMMVELTAAVENSKR